MTRAPAPYRARRLVGDLRRDRSGLALLEFAFTLPLVLGVGGYGSELSYLALTNLKVSQYALNLADHASRVGLLGGSGVTQLREADVNDVLAGTWVEGKAMNLTTYGRVTLSSLENTKQSYDTAYTQRIHWQRCIGAMSGTGYDSTFGTTTTTDGTDGTQTNDGTTMANGMGNAGSKVSASQGTGVMFVEVNYKYQPLFGTMFLFGGVPIIHYIASFVVRDNRDFTQIYNPSPAATRSTCDLHNATPPTAPH